MFELLARAADANLEISRRVFKSCVRAVLRRQNRNVADSKLDSVTEKLFNILDVDRSGKVDFHELACGLSILCGGDSSEKVRSAFELFDVNGDGFISPDELQQYLECVYSIMFAADPHAQDNARLSPKNLAIETVDIAFKECDRNHDGKLNYDEFQRWFESEKRNAKLASVGGKAPPAIPFANTQVKDRVGVPLQLEAKNTAVVSNNISPNAEANVEPQRRNTLDLLYGGEDMQDAADEMPARRNTLKLLYSE